MTSAEWPLYLYRNSWCQNHLMFSIKKLSVLGIETDEEYLDKTLSHLIVYR